MRSGGWNYFRAINISKKPRDFRLSQLLLQEFFTPIFKAVSRKTTEARGATYTYAPFPSEAGIEKPSDMCDSK